MHLFSLSFILFLFKLSFGPRFWNNIGNNDFMFYKRATSTECLAKKLKKHELDLSRTYIFKHTCFKDINQSFCFERGEKDYQSTSKET